MTTEYPKMHTIYKGLFDLDRLTITVRNFLIQEGFVPLTFPEDGIPKDETAWETYYSERGSPTRYDIRWETKKVANNYFRHLISVRFVTVAATKVEVPIEGKKERMHSGEVDVEIKGVLETDYKKEWENHWFLKHVKKKYEVKIMRDEREAKEGNLLWTINQLNNVVKKYLRIESKEIPGVIEEARRM